jgi:YjbE family integral membrane protein
MEFWTALLSIVIIDLVLAGDNAIVVGMAARQVPKELQRKVIFWGTAGAVVTRVLATVAVVWILKVSGLLLAGGATLVWIAYKLLAEEKQHEVKAADTMLVAIRNIIIADTVMGLDNVLAVAGAAHHHVVLVILGLAISMPIVIGGSTLVLRWMERFAWLIYVGAGVLAYTAVGMMTDERWWRPFFEENVWLKYGLMVLVIAGVLIAGHFSRSRREEVSNASF